MSKDKKLAEESVTSGTDLGATGSASVPAAVPATPTPATMVLKGSVKGDGLSDTDRAALEAKVRTFPGTEKEALVTLKPECMDNHHFRRLWHRARS